MSIVTVLPPRPPAAVRSGLRQRLMAWALAWGGDRMHQALGPHKQRLLGPLEGDVLEVGPGVGANFRYYRPSVRWTGVEPNRFSHGPLLREAARYGIAAQVAFGVAEALPQADGTMDAVVSTLVLCSVAHPAKVLAEAQRVLRPGGRFVFIEHVAAPAGTPLRRLQDALAPAWRLLADGCHPNRETGAMLQQAGFRELDIVSFDAAFPLVRPHIAGSGRKPVQERAAC